MYKFSYNLALFSDNPWFLHTAGKDCLDTLQVPADPGNQENTHPPDRGDSEAERTVKNYHMLQVLICTAGMLYKLVLKSMDPYHDKKVHAFFIAIEYMHKGCLFQLVWSQDNL